MAKLKLDLHDIYNRAVWAQSKQTLLCHYLTRNSTLCSERHGRVDMANATTPSVSLCCKIEHLPINACE